MDKSECISNMLSSEPIATGLRRYELLVTILLLTAKSAIANHPSSHAHHHGMHHHMHHHHPSHHQPAIVPPSSSSAPLGQTYVHKYSYTLPGEGSYVKMSRTYHRPYLPSFVGTEQFRSSSPFPAQDASNQRLKDHALLSSLSFLPDLLQGDSSPGDISQKQNDTNSSEEYHNPKYDPFNPRYAVERFEVSDVEWEAEMQEDFESSGLLSTRGKRGIMAKVPKGLVNLNFGTHTCVHMGTELKSSESAYAPTALSFPIESVESNKLHAIIMVDLDRESTKDQNNIEVTDEDLISSNLYLHWMVINVPGAKVDQGQTVTSYKGPAPKPGSGVHRYVILAYEQKSDTPMRIDHSGATFRTSFPCQESGRSNFDLSNFLSRYNMTEHPVAANYFQVQYDEFVDNINESCAVDQNDDLIQSNEELIAFHALPILNSRFL